MIYLLFFLIGVSVGIVILAPLKTSGHYDDLLEAYEQGLNDGKNEALKDVNNLYNKYKDMADGNNDIRC